MSSTTFFSFLSLYKNYHVARNRSHSQLSDAFHVPRMITTTSKHGYCNLTTHPLHSTSVNHQRRSALNATNNPQPVAPIPSGSPSSGWSKWMLLTLIPLSILFIFFKSRWGRLLMLKQQLDKTLATVDVMADELEDAAEKVDKMADEISEKFPEGSSLRKAIDMVGDLAEKTNEAAESVGDVSGKVDDAEDKLKKLILESAKKKAKWRSSDTPKVK